MEATYAPIKYFSLSPPTEITWSNLFSRYPEYQFRANEQNLCGQFPRVKHLGAFKYFSCRLNCSTSRVNFLKPEAPEIRTNRALRQKLRVLSHVTLASGFVANCV